MNKFSKQIVLGLSCLGALSVVSCDNETEAAKVPPFLEKVSFSARNPNAEADATAVTFAAGDKIKLYMEQNAKAVKYYTDSDRKTGTALSSDGTEFKFVADGDDVVISGGFYLEITPNRWKKYYIKNLILIKEVIVA